jgi:hypothetical protein
MALGSPEAFDLVMTLIILICWGSAEIWKWRRTPRVAFSFVLGLAAFMSWKHSFTRYENYTTIFFVFAGIAPFVSWPTVTTRLQYLLLVVAVVLGNFNAFLVTIEKIRQRRQVNYTLMIKPCLNILTILLLDEQRNYLDQALRLKEQKYTLARIRETVGDATVDFMFHDQGMAFLNGLNYHPRPMFQSCTATTRYLMRRNAAFFECSDAPDYVVFRPLNIDHRLPSMVDSQALKVLIGRYVPLFIEGDYLLLKKSADRARVLEESPVFSGEVALNEWVDIRSWHDRYLLLSLDIRYSVAGKVGNTLYRPPIIYMELMGAGWERRYRIIPEMTVDSFLLQPLLRNSSRDFLRWFEPGGSEAEPSIPQRIDAFRFCVEHEWEALHLCPSIGVRLTEWPGY